jgi:hypothetical protein
MAEERAKIMPMNSPGWFDDLPEYMTEAEYRELSEEISRTIEIVHGHVTKCEWPVPGHNRIARRLSVARPHTGIAGCPRRRDADDVSIAQSTCC